MRILPALLASAALHGAGPAVAQEVSDRVKQTCRSVSSQTARTIVYALRANIDPATQVKRSRIPGWRGSRPTCCSPRPGRRTCPRRSCSPRLQPLRGPAALGPAIAGST